MIALLIAIALPTDRSFVLAQTTTPTAEVATCAAHFWDGFGRADVVQTDYGQRVDLHFLAPVSLKKGPSVSLEIHDDHSLVMYGYGAWRGGIKGLWKKAAKRCFSDSADAVPTEQAAQ
jgi:hypothetical protein